MARRIGLPAAVMAVLVALPGAASAEVWTSRADAVRSWRSIDPDVTNAFFGPESFTFNKTTQPERHDFEGNAMLFASYRALVRTSPNAFPPGTLVAYDPEPAPTTPRREQYRPRRYMRDFVQLAHRRGLRAMLVPSRRLGNVDIRRCQFLQCGYLEIPADYFQLQSQRLQCDLPAFTRFVRGASRRSVSPLIVQMSVLWDGPCDRVPAVVAAHDAALPYADGFSLWGGPGDTEGVEVLRRIAEAQH
jgi:hypothetical protein